jgi:hypothetical protein
VKTGRYTNRVRSLLLVFSSIVTALLLTAMVGCAKLRPLISEYVPIGTLESSHTITPEGDDAYALIIRKIPRLPDESLVSTNRPSNETNVPSVGPQ